MRSTRKGKGMAIAMAAVVALACITTASAQEGAKVINRPLTHQEVHDLELPEGTQVSGGLETVGVGSAVYLEALADAAIGFNSVSWEVTAAPTPSSATLQASPLGDNVGIYSPGDRQVHVIAGRQLLVPDVVGQYTVTATIQTDSGAVAPSITITAATYVGVGIVGGAEPAFPQCALCHAEQTQAWVQTRHASKLQRELDGLGSGFYNEGCIGCHTVGFDDAATAVNGGFDDAAAATGWEFPTKTDENGDVVSDLKFGNFGAMPPELQAMANIQCESCHGPGSEHAGDPTKISTSLDAGDCAVCHDELPYHENNLEWASSGHAVATRYPAGEGRETCVICHSGKGFIDAIKGGYHLETPGYQDMVEDVTWNEISCQVCHEPHSVENHRQLRRIADVELVTGEVITRGGDGKLCMTCHRARRGGDDFASVYNRRQDTHPSAQADMLTGNTGAEFGLEIRSSTHIFAVENACAECHMQSVPRDDPAYAHAGGHSFNMVDDNRTPDDPSDDRDLTGTCANCHGPVDSFDLPREDFDGDGTVEGVQTEVTDLMHMLAMALPPLGQPEIEHTEEFTPDMLRATFNHNFVEEDGSHGVHNARYAVGLLKASYKAVTGRDIITAVTAELGEGTPDAFALDQNFPNPFNPATEIRYSLPSATDVRLEIYNSIGQSMRTLVDAYHATGSYTVRWDGNDDQGRQLTAGVYLYTLTAGEFRSQRKMVLLP